MLAALLLSLAQSKVFLEERFDSGWENRWKKPTKVRKGVQLGRFRLSAGDFFGNERLQRGIETIDSRRNYLLYSNFTHNLDSREHDLVLQYTLRTDMWVDCSGQYIKLLPSKVDPTEFSNETEYGIMFGPDICGATVRKTHVIIVHKGKQYPMFRSLTCFKDHLTHSYTLIIRKDNTIEVQIDGETVDEAPLSERFAIPVPDEIPDPNDKKPADWDDDEWIIDPEDKKPSDWIDEEFVADPDAFKPPNWDDSIPWSPPMIRNPDYKGEWAPRVIKNPKYSGVWQPKMIPNTEGIQDPTFGHFDSLGFLGLEFFQNVPGSIFDNFLVTDSEEYAREMLEEVFLNIREDEVRSYDELSKRLAKEKEIERLRSDRDMEDHHDMDSFTDDESDSEKDYFKKRRELKKSGGKGKKSVDQFDDL